MSYGAGPQARIRRVLGTVAALVGAVAVVAVVVMMLRSTGIIGGGLVPAEALGRVLVVAASPNESGDVVGQILFVADLTGETATIEPVSSGLEVSIPGTTYHTLADVYPFKGGAGTADAYAQATNADALPFVALDAAALAAAVQEAGGMRLNLPAPITVFDGTRMYDFKQGIQTVSAAELVAVLKGATYLNETERTLLEVQLARGLAGTLAQAPGAIAAASTNLDEAAQQKLVEKLATFK